METLRMKKIFLFTFAVVLFIGTVPALAQTATQVAKLVATDMAEEDNFGFSVAVSGDTAVVGARFDDAAGSNSGSAYVFVRNPSDGTWTQQAKLTAMGAAAGDNFGFSVSVDGDTAVVGAYQDDDAGSTSGSAYVFTRSGSTWTQQAKLTAADAATGDHFGFSVAVSGDTAVVGARFDDFRATNSGSAYIFTRSGSTWIQQAKLTASDGAFVDLFGSSVAINVDTIVVGAKNDDDAGSNSGSAYVFTRSGTMWSQQVKLTAGDAAAGDNFGISVAVSGDTAVIGAFLDDDASSQSGSAYVFSRSGSTWTQQSKLTAADAALADQFGISVSVSGDTAVVGAYSDDDAGFQSGSAYVFSRSGSTWTQQAKLTAADAATGDRFGISVSVSGDTAVVGANQDDDAGANSGSAYVFSLTPPNTPPVAEAGPDQTVECTSPSGASVTLDGSGSTDPDGDLLTYTWDGPFGMATGESPIVNMPMNTSPTIANVTLTVSDSTETNTDNVIITVQDTTPPAITAPDDVSVEQTSFSGTSVTLGTPTVSDICDANPVVTNDAPALFPQGSTTVTWTATDASGNFNTAKQTVTVLDTTAPTVRAKLRKKKGCFRVKFSAIDNIDTDPTIVALLNGVSVTNGQLVKLKHDDGSSDDDSNDDDSSDDDSSGACGDITLAGSSFTLKVTATDDSGNVGTESDTFVFPSRHGDDCSSDDRKLKKKLKKLKKKWRKRYSNNNRKGSKMWRKWMKLRKKCRK